jgi:hypothetical protein
MDAAPQNAREGTVPSVGREAMLQAARRAAMPQTARREAIRAGLLLGWLSVVAVLLAVALDVGAHHPTMVVALALAGAGWHCCRGRGCSSAAT